MVKFVVQFYQPSDPEAFEFVYNAFLALVERMPLITRRQVNSVLGSPFGETKIFRVLEIYFEDYARMARAKGFLLVSATPLTRASYHADRDFAALRAERNAHAAASPMAASPA